MWPFHRAPACGAKEAYEGDLNFSLWGASDTYANCLSLCGTLQTPAGHQETQTEEGADRPTTLLSIVTRYALRIPAVLLLNVLIYMHLHDQKQSTGKEQTTKAITTR